MIESLTLPNREYCLFEVLSRDYQTQNPLSVVVTRLIPLQFVDPPTNLKAGEAFTVFISASESVPSILEQTMLFLVCNEVLIQSWSMVELNLEKNLTLDSNTAPFLTNCFLKTPDDDEYYTEASTPVSVEPIDSPSGGNFYPITPEQLAEFISTLPTTPGNPFVPTSFNM